MLTSKSGERKSKQREELFSERTFQKVSVFSSFQHFRIFVASSIDNKKSKTLFEIEQSKPRERLPKSAFMVSEIKCAILECNILKDIFVVI